MPKCTVNNGSSNGPGEAESVPVALPAPAADMEVPEPVKPAEAHSEPKPAVKAAARGVPDVDV